MESTVYDLFNAGIAVDLLVPTRYDASADVGIRLRPFSKNLPRNRMVLSSGATFEEALNGAVTKAEAGRWETLDWAARPWEVTGHTDRRTYGL